MRESNLRRRFLRQEPCSKNPEQRCNAEQLHLSPPTPTSQVVQVITGSKLVVMVERKGVGAAAVETQRSKGLTLIKALIPRQLCGKHQISLMRGTTPFSWIFLAVLTKQLSANKSGAVHASAVHANKICREHIKLVDKSQSKGNL